ncbi:hypothetical protein [Bifidobacterium pseudolongum]|uniref:hypothetical protein n=1 Tax=Bifidobacterium pseudolongum TaxID=1694 RepID=UPI001A924F6C|nr:hypothetical protein [Bifidobacterium pseudolongum]
MLDLRDAIYDAHQHHEEQYAPADEGERWRAEVVIDTFRDVGGADAVATLEHAGEDERQHQQQRHDGRLKTHGNGEEPAGNGRADTFCLVARLIWHVCPTEFDRFVVLPDCGFFRTTSDNVGGARHSGAP